MKHAITIDLPLEEEILLAKVYKYDYLDFSTTEKLMVTKLVSEGYIFKLESNDCYYTTQLSDIIIGNNYFYYMSILDMEA